MHYTLNDTLKQILATLSGALKETAEFVEVEIIESLPKNAQKDFRECIDHYMKYSEELSKKFVLIH